MSCNQDLIKALRSGDRHSEQLLKLVSKNYKTLYNAMFHHHSTRGKPMDFIGYRYLVDLYMDNAVKMYVKSSVQSGKSEFAVVDHLCKAEMGLTVLYVLPDDKLRTRFTRNRVDKLFSTVPYYKEMYAKGVGGSKNVNLKHYGRGTIVYANSGSANDFKELPADALYLDEYDQMNMSIVESAEDRLSSSDFKLVRCVANPTVSNFGIDEKFNNTDQKFWMIKCSSCSHWQTINFFKNITRMKDDDTYELIDRDWSLESKQDIKCFCEKCFSPIDRLSENSQWVAKHKGRLESGYHITKMFSPHNMINELWHKYCLANGNPTRLQVFYNSDLGECFKAAGSSLTPELLNGCKGDYIMPLKCDYPCSMGIDVGTRLHVVINRIFPDGDMQLVGLFELKNFIEIDNLILRFNIKCFVVDAMPETRKSLELCQRFDHIAYMCRYIEGRLDEMQGLKKATSDGSTRYAISADRLLIMDNVMEKFITQKFIIPKNADSLFDGRFYDMLCCPTRTFETDGGSGGRYFYTKGEDHFFHAYNYSLLARYNMRDQTVHFIGDEDLSGDDALRARLLNEQGISIPATVPPHLHDFYKSIMDREAKILKK